MDERQRNPTEFPSLSRCSFDDADNGQQIWETLTREHKNKNEKANIVYSSHILLKEQHYLNIIFVLLRSAGGYGI